jgi:hypothetical protein
VTPSRRLRWPGPERQVPEHPFRDTLLVYAFLAALVVLLAWITGGDVVHGVVVAVAVWIAASAWSMWRWRTMLRRRERDGEEPPL